MDGRTPYGKKGERRFLSIVPASLASLAQPDKRRCKFKIKVSLKYLQIV